MLTKRLRKKIEQRKIVIGVIGLGYVGLPLAVEFAKSGVKVIGFDIDISKVKKINKGSSYIPDIKSDDLEALISDGRLSASTNFKKLNKVDVVFICVPTPFTKAKAPDISYIINAARSVKDNLRKGQLVVLQSTTYPGTTEEVVKPILEDSGLKAGEDFFLAFSPERIDPGNTRYTAKNTPKVIGGMNRASTQLTCDVFALMIGKKYICPVSGTRTAEMCKLLENTFRSVNIALVNELALLSDRMKIDVWEVINAASTKPFGYMPFYPGPGVGGHCIPVDPYYLSWKAREFDFYSKFIELAAEVNQSMPHYTVNRIMRMLNMSGKPLKGTKILVLGVAFKKDINDARNSPALEVIRLLKGHGAEVIYSDPFVPQIDVHEELKYGDFPKIILRSQALSDKLLASVDLAAVLVNHTSFPYRRIVSKARLIFDAVNALKDFKEIARTKITKL